MMEGVLVLVCPLAAILYSVVALRSPQEVFSHLTAVFAALADEILCPFLYRPRLFLLLLHRFFVSCCRVVVMLLCWYCLSAGDFFLLSSMSASPHELSFSRGIFSPL